MVNPSDSVHASGNTASDIVDLRAEINRTNDVLESIGQNLQVLRKRTVWNRIFTGLMGILILIVIIFGMVLYRESKQADQNLRLSLVESCDTFNQLTTRILDEERNLINALATVTEADPGTVDRFLKILAEQRGDKLNLLDCNKFIHGG